MSFIAQLLFRAATPENPRFSLNDPSAWDALGAEPASSGVNVNAESALTHAPWWRAINLLSNSVAKLPLAINRRTGRLTSADQEHAGYFLLRRKPNDFQTAGTFKKQLTSHALSRGNGYAYINRRGDGAPVELVPLDPDDTYPVRENGRMWYCTRAKGNLRKIRAEDVLHIKGYGYDGLCGYNVVQKARESLGLGMGAKKFSSVFFRNGARSSVTLSTPNKMDEKPKRELRESWERMHTGLDNAHRTAILDNGLKAERMSFSAEDSQLIDTMDFNVREIALFVGVPQHKLGDNSGASYNSLEQENQAYLDDSLDPWLVTWEEECWDKLLTEEEKAAESHEVTFDRRQLERADTVTRATYNRAALGGMPWLTVNDARINDGLSPTDDPADDTIQKPLNMGQGGAADSQAPPTPPKRKARQAVPSRNGTPKDEGN